MDLHFITVFFLILEYIYLNVSTSYQNLWKKTYEALNFINQKYNLESFDYILKVGKHWENFQELWVPKNGQKQPKLAKFG